MRRIFAASFLGLALTASPSFAADENTDAVIAPAITAAASALAPRPELLASLTTKPSFEARRPLLLPALYAGSALLQGYDAYSTLSVLKQGGVEANPVMKQITKSPAAFIGLKAGVATLSILAAERMWKTGNRWGAVVTMVASNSFMTYVAAHNARVLSQVQAR